MKGTNNRLSNGIVPLQIVCEQVGSLGVPTCQVSTGLNKTELNKSQSNINIYRFIVLVLKDEATDMLLPFLTVNKSHESTKNNNEQNPVTTIPCEAKASVP